jgi:hypothetical protein
MCQCKECNNKEMELLPEFEGMFGNEFEMEINPEFGIPDFISDAAQKIVSPVLDGAQTIVSPFYKWIVGGSSSANAQASSAREPFINADANVGKSTLGGFVKGVDNIMGSFMERMKVQNLIANGNRNENALTDMIFFNRHPELGKKPLHKSMPNFEDLSKEWLSIRNNIVRPILFKNKSFETFYPEMEFESETVTPLVSMVDPKKVSCLTSPYKEAIFKKIGTSDPAAVLNAISNRAVEMLTNTIDELTRIKTRVRAGDSIDYNLISKNLAFGLRYMLLMKVKERDAWLGNGTRNAGLIIRWLSNIRNRIASKDLWFTCLDTAAGICKPTTWAYVYPGRFRIHLCQRFWIASSNVNAARHFEYQAQTLIHEVSHMYYNTKHEGMGPGVAECLAQFIANSNNSPVEPIWVGACGVANPHINIDAKYGTG